MMKQHTQTPWYAVPLGEHEGDAVAISASDECAIACIAVCQQSVNDMMEPDGEGGSRSYLHYSIDAEECLANAEFICRAVNNHNVLLLALRDLVYWAKRADERHRVAGVADSTWQQLVDSRMKAEYAIAEAMA